MAGPNIQNFGNISAGTITNATWNGSAISAAYGGSGQSSYTTGALLYASSSSALSQLTPTTNGYVLTLSGGLPVWAAASGGSAITSLTGDVTATGPGAAAASLVATSNSTLVTLSALSLPYSQITGAPAAITALTGDATASGPGSATLTLATVATAGTTGSSTAIPVITINAKGLTTSITTAAVVAPAGTLSGTTLNSTVVTSSLTSLGTQASALDMGTNQIHNVTDPSSAQDAATKNYVDNAINGLTWKGPVQAYADSNYALTGGATLTIDSYSVQNGDYVILGNQTTATQNYVYVASGIGTAYTLTLIVGSEAPTAIGDAYLIEHGTVYGDTAFQVNQITPNVTFIQFAGPNIYAFTSPLKLTGNVVSVGYDDSTIGDNGSNQLYVKNNGITSTQLASGSVTYAKIQNESASTLLGNPTGGSAAPSEITLGATLAFSGSALETDALTGDVTSSANSFVTTVAQIAGTTVSGTTGTGNVVFSASPTLTGTITAAAANFSGAIGANAGITSTGALTIDANAGASAVQIEALNVQRSTDGTNFITEKYVDSTSLTDNTTAAVTAFQFAVASFAGEEITYVIESGDANADRRIGTIRVTANSSGTITPSLVDSYAESADCGVSWTATNSGGTISVNYTTTTQGAARTMRADCKFFRS